MDPFHPFELDPRLLGDGLSLRVRVRLGQLLDLGGAGLPRVDRVAVAGLGIRGLGVLEHLVRGVDRDAVRPRAADLPAGRSEDLGRRAPERLAGRGDVMLDAVQERVGLEVSAFLHRDRGVGELPLERDRVRLARLTEGDNVVPGPEDAFVQLALRLGVLVLHPLVDEGLHVDGLAQRDGVVDFPAELAGDDRIQAAGRVRQDDLQRPLHDRAEVQLPRRLRPTPGARASRRLFRAFWARSGMSAYTPFRRASCACVRSFRASVMLTPSRRDASTSALARSRIVSALAYLRWESAFSIALADRDRTLLYSLSARALRASASKAAASSTFPPRSRACRTRDSALSTLAARIRSRRWSRVRTDTRRRRRSAVPWSPRAARARACSMFRWNARVSMPACFASWTTASAYLNASATRLSRRMESRAPRQARGMC